MAEITGELISDAALNAAVEKRLRVILDEGARTPMSVDRVPPTLPPFYDERKFRLGQKTFRDNVFSMMIAKLIGLLTLLSIKNLLSVIMFTKKSGTSCLAYRRYASTILHMFTWLEKDPRESKEFMESIKIVRNIHCVAFKRSTEAGIHKPTQLDMALAQFGFIGYVLVSTKQLGIRATYEELESLTHCWRVIGSMLGMDDRFNLCTGTLEETCALCQKLLEEVFIPNMLDKNKDFDDMSRALLEGVWPVCTAINPDAFTAFTFYLTSLSASNNNVPIDIDTSKMSLYSWWMFHTKCFVVKHLLRSDTWWYLFFRSFFNGLMLLSIFSLRNYPFIATWTFGKKYSRVNILRPH